MAAAGRSLRNGDAPLLACVDAEEEPAAADAHNVRCGPSVH